VERSELARVQKYLRDKFRLDTISLKGRSGREESAEVYIGDEFIGVLFKDDEEGEVSYAFEMAILEMDLPNIAGI